MTPPTWTDEEIAKLAELAGQRLSAGQISRATGRSRNAVIGMARRRGITINSERGEKLRSGITKMAEKRKGKSRPVAGFKPILIPMIDRRDTQCPFPMWAHTAESGAPDFIVCGTAKALDACYCPHHMTATHYPKQPRSLPSIVLREGFKRQGPARSGIIDFTFIDGEAA